MAVDQPAPKARHAPLYAALVILAAIAIAAGPHVACAGGCSAAATGTRLPAETRRIGAVQAHRSFPGSTTVTLVQDTNGPLVIGASPRNAPRITAKVQDETLIIYGQRQFALVEFLFGRGSAQHAPD